MIGGIGAILWAMRDRLVSVAIPREPERPAFRVPEPSVPGAEPVEADRRGEERPTSPSVTDVSGIGPVYATRLEAAGVATLPDLAKSAPEDVAEAAEVPVARARSWIESAQALLEG